MATKPVGVHLVGSVPVETARDMFRLSVEHLGAHLKRLPDGEVGERNTWIRWQYAKIKSSPQMEPRNVKNVYVPVPPLGIVAGVESAADIKLPNLGYADAAIESFDVFKEMQAANFIPPDVRFQVGLPTPLSVAIFYVVEESRAEFEKAYGTALYREVARMLEHIPAGKLAIQWETVSEFGMLEGLMPNHLGTDLAERITDRLAALVDLVPEPAEAGLHLCYGDSGHKHFCEPADAGHLAAISASILRKASGRIAWIHMPVPRDRDDAEYFAPLATVDIPIGTDLYLGLVHLTGGIDGTLRRVNAASKYVPRYGIATECGFGRRDPATIAALMQQHAAVAEPVAN